VKGEKKKGQRAGGITRTIKKGILQECLLNVTKGGSQNKLKMRKERNREGKHPMRTRKKSAVDPAPVGRGGEALTGLLGEKKN